MAAPPTPHTMTRTFAPDVRWSQNPFRTLSIYAGVVCNSYEALVDTAAEDAVIGDRAMSKLQQALRERGLQTLTVSSGVSLPGAAGIGGQAQVTLKFQSEWASQWGSAIHGSSRHR